MYINTKNPQNTEKGFRKGITLQDYMKSSSEIGQLKPQSPQQQDLYDSEKINPNKMVTFAINEIQEYDYREESSNLDNQAHIKQYDVDEPLQVAIQWRQKQKNAIKFNEQRQTLKIPNGMKGFRIKNQSNSPKKISQSPKKEMFRSLYGNQFGGTVIRPSFQSSNMSSTIHNKFFVQPISGNHPKKQVQIKEKNKKTYNQIIKYENVVRNKIYGKLDNFQFRVDGIKDRLCVRKSSNHY